MKKDTMEKDTILCSTGALIGRPNNRDFRLLKTIVPQLHCDGIEFMMYSTWYNETEPLVETLKSLQVPVPVLHCEKHIGEGISQGTEGDIREALRRFEINCKLAEQIGAGKIVMHLWDGITSDSNFQCNFETYEKAHRIAEQYGTELLIENVVCNVENPMKHWCELAERYPDVKFIFDTKMAAFHGQMELLYVPEYEWLWEKNHIRHFHINDYAGGYMEWEKLKTLPIGEGHVDFPRFFAFLQEKGYSGTFTVEATAFDQNGRVDVDMLNTCFDRIREFRKV